MIIPLTFIPEDKLFIFRCIVKVSHFHEVFGNVRFIYDTGSSGSFIGQEDALSFIDPKTKQIQRIQCKNFHVGKCASNKPDIRIRDSIIGNSFLVEHKLRLIANPHSNSYLESV